MRQILLQCHFSQAFQDFLGTKSQIVNPILKKERAWKRKEQGIKMRR